MALKIQEGQPNTTGGGSNYNMAVGVAPVNKPRFIIGAVGQPNTGKSSVLNAIIGHKQLSVSRTAGHTKHFQHIYLDKPGIFWSFFQPAHSFEVIFSRLSFSTCNFNFLNLV